MQRKQPILPDTNWLNAALLLMLVTVTGCGTPMIYHFKHYQSPFRALSDRHKTYFHSSQTGKIIPKDECVTYTEPGCFGYEPTTWTRWPSDCVGNCPVQGEVLVGEEFMPIEAGSVHDGGSVLSPHDAQPAAPTPAGTDAQTGDEDAQPGMKPELDSADDLKTLIPDVPVDAESAVPSPSDSGRVNPQTPHYQPMQPRPARPRFGVTSSADQALRQQLEHQNRQFRALGSPRVAMRDPQPSSLAPKANRLPRIQPLQPVGPPPAVSPHNQPTRTAVAAPVAKRVPITDGAKVVPLPAVNATDRQPASKRLGAIQQPAPLAAEQASSNLFDEGQPEPEVVRVRVPAKRVPSQPKLTAKPKSPAAAADRLSLQTPDPTLNWTERLAPASKRLKAVRSARQPSLKVSTAARTLPKADAIQLPAATKSQLNFSATAGAAQPKADAAATVMTPAVTAPKATGAFLRLTDEAKAASKLTDRLVAAKQPKPPAPAAVQVKTAQPAAARPSAQMQVRPITKRMVAARPDTPAVKRSVAAQVVSVGVSSSEVTKTGPADKSSLTVRANRTRRVPAIRVNGGPANIVRFTNDDGSDRQLPIRNEAEAAAHGIRFR